MNRSTIDPVDRTGIVVELNLAGLEHLPDVLVTVDTGRAAIEAGATAWVRESRFLPGALCKKYFGVKSGRLIRKTHGAADKEVDSIRHEVHLLPAESLA